MANQQHMYRRGAVYWWRRVLDLSPSVRYDMRISLRTAIKTEARQRADIGIPLSDVHTDDMIP
jgi:hypothetical protein